MLYTPCLLACCVLVLVVDCKICGKISSIDPSTFNAVMLQRMIFNDKPWTHAKTVCKTLEYKKDCTHSKVSL